MPAHEEGIDDPMGALLDEGAPHLPQLQPRDLDAVIQRVEYYVFPGTTLTVCALIHINGTVITGVNDLGSAATYNRDLGEALAFNNARGKLWELERFLMLENRANGQTRESAFW